MPQSFPDFYDPFITVVTVGADEKPIKPNLKAANMINSEFVTVLTIGNEESKSIKDVTEEVVVYRLPGEKLGFGLKFEGGTKAHEFVKRLFIQSCASDSPASRVQSSWGQLVEGDEVLKIDCMPVNTMTRIDCVRFLKDSNVAIKLLVKHTFNNNKKTDDIPVIVSEEKKPPPVPPRKIHRKLQKTLQGLENFHQGNNILAKINNINNQQESFFTLSSRLQSPRNSGRKKSSPDFIRRISDGSLGPPDAEVYLDLFSQESAQSLSESDDTGSTISTVLDRFASFPTTTTSSFAGSLPSTPTSLQKKLDLSYVNDFDDLLDKRCVLEENNNIIDENEEGVTKFLGEDSNSCNGDDLMLDETDFRSEVPKRPMVAPRSKDKINKPTNSEDLEPTLPRLVDFLPKSPSKELREGSMDTLKRFLESERFDFDYPPIENIDDGELDFIANEMDLYGSKWIMSSHLSTIGEDEEECREEFSNHFGPISYTSQVIGKSLERRNMEQEVNKTNEVVINHEDQEENIVLISFVDQDDEESRKFADNQESMEIPPSDSRQPPDGHEFPDFIENHSPVKSLVPKDSAFVNEGPKVHTSSFNFTWNELKSSTLDRSISSSNCDLRPVDMRESEDEHLEPQTSNLLHTRSQSLIDMSIFSKEKNNWSVLAEQRKRRLSKLKGLVIPEATENESTLCDIPEIKSSTTAINLPILPNLNLNINNKISTNGFEPKTLEIQEIKPIVLPSWTTNTTIPKYSPAFKRKSLQVYPIKKTESTELSSYDEYLQNNTSPPRSSSNDDPKSLESIASPTRSDCSFDYMTRKSSKNINSNYDESDNDSAVSSSQSSYNSRCSPPPSPVSDNNQNRLVLKPSSVEAINRKNILQSARCSSGKDFKVGSPVIQRKFDEEDQQNQVRERVRTNFTTTVTMETSTLVLSNISESNGELSLNKAPQQPVEEKSIPTEPPSLPTAAPPIPKERTHIPADKVQVKETMQISESIMETPTNFEIKTTARTFKTESKVEMEPVQEKPQRRSVVDKPQKVSSLIEKVENKARSERSFSLEESKFNSDMLAARLERYSAGSILDRRNKPQPISVKNMMKNFESTVNSTPVFPKNFKVESKGTLAQKTLFEPVKPVVAKRNIAENGTEKPKEEKTIRRQSSEDRLNKREPLKRSSLVNGSKDNLNGSRDESFSNYSLHTVMLTLDNVGTSLGITLAGGTDYENKVITIHRIRYGSIAYQDGRLKKGDKIISINGISTEGLTHETASDLLKTSSKKFTIVVEDSNDVLPSSSLSNLSRRSSSSMTSLSSESTKGALDDLNSSILSVKEANNNFTLVKDGGGLGFSIEGGKDSPKGDVPLVVKKIFTGGAAEKSGKLQPGDEILCVNGINFRNLSRIEAWNIMKKIPEGDVKIEIFR